MDVVSGVIETRDEKSEGRIAFTFVQIHFENVWIYLFYHHLWVK